MEVMKECDIYVSRDRLTDWSEKLTHEYMETWIITEMTIQICRDRKNYSSAGIIGCEKKIIPTSHYIHKQIPDIIKASILKGKFKILRRKQRTFKHRELCLKGYIPKRRGFKI